MRKRKFFWFCFCGDRSVVALVVPRCSSLMLSHRSVRQVSCGAAGSRKDFVSDLVQSVPPQLALADVVAYLSSNPSIYSADLPFKLYLCDFFFFFSLPLKVEGVRGLWKGNWSSVVRIYPYAAIQFASFERYKRGLRALSPSGSMFFGGHFLAGSMAGATAVCFTYPLDVVRARLAFQFASKGDEKKSSFFFG